MHNKKIKNAILNNLEYIKIETLAKKLTIMNKLEKGFEINFDDISTKIFLTLHK